MSPLDWFKKQKPMLSMQSMGGGAAGLMISGAPPAIDASGGTKTTPGDGYVYHQFLSGGTFAVNSAGKGSDGIIDLCLVGGGGGGSLDGGGGGGGGGFRITTVDIAGYGAGNYPISVGNGGAGQPVGTPGPTRPPASDGDSSAFAIPASISPSPISIICGGGGGAGPIAPPTNNGRPGQPSPFPTASPPHPNATVYPGSGGGGRKGATTGGLGASSPSNSPKAFNSGSGGKGFGNFGGGGGGAAGDGGPSPATNTSADAKQGAQLPWALPTWGWGQLNPAGLSGASPTSPDPTRPAGPGGQLPWGYGWFAGGGGGGGSIPGTSDGGYGYAGGGAGSRENSPYGGPPGTGSDGFGFWAAPGTGSGGGGAGGSGHPSVPGSAGRGAPGAIMIRYPVG